MIIYLENLLRIHFYLNRETYLGNIKIFINSISVIEKNWLTLTTKQTEILETYLNDQNRLI